MFQSIRIPGGNGVSFTVQLIFTLHRPEDDVTFLASIDPKHSRPSLSRNHETVVLFSFLWKNSKKMKFL